MACSRTAGKGGKYAKQAVPNVFYKVSTRKAYQTKGAQLTCCSSAASKHLHQLTCGAADERPFVQDAVRLLPCNPSAQTRIKWHRPGLCCICALACKVWLLSGLPQTLSLQMCGSCLQCTT